MCQIYTLVNNVCATLYWHLTVFMSNTYVRGLTDIMLLKALGKDRARSSGVQFGVDMVKLKAVAKLEPWNLSNRPLLKQNGLIYSILIVVPREKWNKHDCCDSFSQLRQLFGVLLRCVSIKGLKIWVSDMETLSGSLALREGNPLVTGGFPSQRPVVRSLDISTDVSLDETSLKHLNGRWFQTPFMLNVTSLQSPVSNMCSL